MQYRQLDEQRILQTLERLRDRIAERFPESGLRRVGDELLAVGAEVTECVDYLRKPNWPLRALAAAAIMGLAALLVAAAATVSMPTRVERPAELLQLIESGVNDIVFAGIAVFFLLTIETRMKRRRALGVLHQLRSIAHVVDMHQLTKDPERILSPEPDTSSSPVRTMTPSELGRYLDYCSELLSVTSKLSALLVQYFNDEVVLGAVNEVETLTTGLSAKIWQKIRMLGVIAGMPGATRA
ncbi:MAG TPA: hypothetical protein VM939_02405 [Gemmatimonadaceae bacterium]|nr:hypothetical protein [Gemmatimonadaceae bacterium]